MADSPWMTTRETAAYMKVSERRVQQLKKQEKLPHGRTGKKLMFHRTDVDDYMREQNRS